MGYWITRTYKAGKIGEKIKYWISGNPKRRNKRKERSQIKKQRSPQAPVRALARLINANFSAGDMLITLTYSDEGIEKIFTRAGRNKAQEEITAQDIRLAAQQEFANCIRRVKRAVNSELKYIGVTADLDGKTKELVRIHHHMLVNADCAGQFQKAWRKYGSVHTRQLSEQEDYTPVALYFCAQVSHIDDAKTYTRSRNLIIPQPKDRVVYTGSELKLPAKCRLLDRGEWKGHYAPQYIRYVLPERDNIAIPI